MFSTLTIDGRSRHTPSDQIYHYVIDEILSLNIHAQTIFPDCNAVAIQCNMQPADVQEAYARLVAESYCEVEGNTITLKEAELRRSIQLASMNEVLAIGSTMNMESISNHFPPIITMMLPELIGLAKQRMPKQSLLLRTLNLGDRLPLSYVIVVVNVKKISNELRILANDTSFYDLLSNRPDTIVHPTLMSACRLSHEASSLLKLPNNTPAICMHSSIDSLTQADIAQMYVLLTPRVFLSLKT
jgi:DNA-binding transcriptional regulator YhcF (GntR family)